MLEENITFGDVRGHYLECIHPTQNHYKFYLLLRLGSKVLTRWGRINSTGQLKSMNHNSVAAAQAWVAATAGDKCNHGYQQVDIISTELLDNSLKHLGAPKHLAHLLLPPAMNLSMKTSTNVSVTATLNTDSSTSATLPGAVAIPRPPNRLTRFEDI